MFGNLCRIYEATIINTGALMALGPGLGATGSIIFFPQSSNSTLKELFHTKLFTAQPHSQRGRGVEGPLEKLELLKRECALHFKETHFTKRLQYHRYY